jgi:serine/threonine-protein kinase
MSSDKGDPSASGVVPTAGPKDSGERSLQRIFAEGELVGGVYQVGPVLGVGGMGQVFEARDHELERNVALKVAWPDSKAPPLRNEARALAAFRSLNLPTVHALGNHRGLDYLVMERIYGLPLGDHLEWYHNEGQTMALAEAIDLLIPLAEGLATVHQAGIAHRDVKPDNVMLTPDGRVVLMDFGLVLPELEVARQAAAAGSPAYMAPEALANQVEPGRGHLADLYSLGVIAFLMLAGRVPRPATDLQRLWDMHLRDPVPTVDEYRSGVPEELLRLISDLMAKAPSDRPQSAEAVAWRLKAVRDRDLDNPRSGPLDVLIVDDDEHVTRVLDFYVRQILGAVELRVAEDGERALKMIRQKAPDLLLLDLHMPRMNGLELCMFMRGARLAEDTAIIPVSAGAQQHDRQLLHELGIRHFVEKGERLRDRLAEVIEEVIGSQARRRSGA